MGERKSRPPKAERRADILQAATDLFATQGFSETTMDQVAAAVGITKRTLYRYVETKEQLLVEIHGRFGEQLQMYAAVQSDDPLERFAHLLERHVSIVTNQTAEIGVFFDDRKFLSPAYQQDISRRRKFYESVVADAMRDGQKAGVIEEIDPKLASRLLLGAITEIYRWYQPRGRLSPSAISRAVIDTFLFGAATRRPSVSTLARLVAEGTPRPVSRPQPVSARERVRDAAIRSFASSGYRASSIRELAVLAGVTNGAAMYHVEYKPVLLEEIHHGVFDAGMDALQPALDSGGSYTDKLARLIGAQVAFLADHVLEIAVVNENIKFLEPEAYKRINALRGRFLDVFLTVVVDGVSAGEIHTEDGPLLSRLIVGMLNSPYRWYRHPSEESPGLSTVQLAEIIARLLLRGVSVSERPNSSGVPARRSARAPSAD